MAEIIRVTPRPLVSSPPERRVRGNLPSPLAGFVGRDAELSTISALLTTSRLVSVVGVGGVGKTSLALQAAHHAAAAFPGGVWWIELADVRDGLLLTDVVAATLGVHDHSATPLIDLLIRVLSESQTLLVLDNCEHVVNDAGRLVRTLLRRCPQVKILATSREVLRLGGESLLSLSPMPYPSADSTTGAATLVDYDAITFFVERARTAQPGFALTDDNAATVASICAQLDGLPLAIELATARLRAMSLQQIAARLSDRFGLLTRGRRDAPTRQQTLTFCVDWSYDRCTAAEKQLWTRLSVFAGTFDIDAVAYVCAEELPFDDVLDDLCALVDKSIIVRTEHAGVARFKMLETLREFGRARIGSVDEHWRLQQRHLAWYHRLLTRANAEWFSDQQVRWLDRLTTEAPNLREALQFAVEDSPAVALEMTPKMFRIWMSRTMLLSEARRWLDQALKANPVEPTPARITALGFVSLNATWQGDAPTGFARVEQARALLDDVADARLHGLIDYAEGFAALVAGDLDRSQKCLERALTHLADLDMQAVALILLSWVFEARDDIDTAVDTLEKASTLTGGHGETLNRSRVLASLAFAYWRKGDLDRTAQYVTESLRLALLIDDPWIGAEALKGAAWIAEAGGQPRHAAILMGAASAVTAAAGLESPAFANVKPFHDRCELRCREQLGDNEYQDAWNEGHALSFHEAAVLALGA